MQGTSGGLDVVFQFLAALIGAISGAHGDGPDAPRHPTQHRVFRVHAIGEKERNRLAAVTKRNAEG